MYLFLNVVSAAAYHSPSPQADLVPHSWSELQTLSVIPY